ncbi:pathogenesis-related homeodomain protein-like isoform X1 [Zingiber officinale]|uniref:pathogenesis-related homeodomain protein-like isoform X1 n=1 Tax=Zingiber officinale TaxID=94328 RepID=UPI001C4A9D1F|nr:pathogenesis-related homeodomain protein-like isoform X1 [Zingiber officinale]
MKTPEKKLICYQSRKSAVLEKEAYSKMDSESIKAFFHRVIYNKRCRTKPNMISKQRRIRRKQLSSKYPKTMQRITHHISGSDQGTSKLSTDESFCAHNKGNLEVAANKGTIKLCKRKRRKRKRKNVDHDEASRLQRRTKYLLIKIKLEQNLIDAYSGDGWNGQSREKIKPKKELQRAQKQIVKCKLGIRDAIRQLDSLSCVGSIANSLMHPDGSVFHEHIFCAKCRSSEAFRDNDIVLCDGTCNCGFHQKCLEPPLVKIPPGDQAWLCKFCTCKLEILEAINAHLDTCFSVNNSWEDIFKEAAAYSDAENICPSPGHEWPSDDSGDEDYNPDINENSNSRSGIEENASDDSDSLSSLFCSSDRAISHSDLEYYSCHEEPFYAMRSKSKADQLDSLDNFDSGQSNECDIIAHYRRQRRDVDYIKLHDEMFGREPPEDETQSEDEDWGPKMRKRRRVDTSTDICMTNSVTEDMCSHLGPINRLSSHKKRQIFRIPPEAVEKLRLAFSENELPSRSVKETLSKQLGISSEKVSKWFKNARYAALKMRKNLINNPVGNECSSESMNENLSKAFGLPDHRMRKSLAQSSGQKRARREKAGHKGGADHKIGKKNIEHLNLTEVERLCRLQDKLQELKKALMSYLDEKEMTTKTFVPEQNVIYVPVAEVREKS